MASFKDHFSSASNHYFRFRPDYPIELFEYLAKISPCTELALDVGCGNGQATQTLSHQFDRVIGCDASAQQLAQAIPAANIDYRVTPAERLPAETEQVDLVCVAQAIHWFDHPVFFGEVDRVLKPGGVLACWGYQLLNTQTKLDAVVEWFHSELLGDYWPAERALLNDHYSAIPFPYPREKTPLFEMQAKWSFEHLTGYLNTWSAVKTYQDAGHQNPVKKHRQAFVNAWQDLQQPLKIIWPLILYIGKKSI